ncbi:conserved hypothetical protein [Trichinella spiralis]|uniref:hypothetical protein n=1 Tax=Trichinella spiralis TaxID=6334 RepID=UPI0001EFB95E|nr:conserved hypothetical protein [Trichinella spiralis]
MYHSNIKLSPSYGYTPPRYGAPYRTYVHHMDVDDAVDLYKKRCMTSSALVKYWLTPTNSETRRRRELREFEPLYQPSKFGTLLLNLRLLQNLHNHGYLLPRTARIFRLSETSSQLPAVHPSASDVQHRTLPFRNLSFADWSAPNTLLVRLLRTAIHKKASPTVILIRSYLLTLNSGAQACKIGNNENKFSLKGSVKRSTKSLCWGSSSLLHCARSYECS